MKTRQLMRVLTDDQEPVESREDVPPLDFVFYETSFELQKDKPLQDRPAKISLNITKMVKILASKPLKLMAEVPTSPGITSQATI